MDAIFKKYEVQFACLEKHCAGTVHQWNQMFKSSELEIVPLIVRTFDLNFLSAENPEQRRRAILQYSIVVWDRLVRFAERKLESSFSSFVIIDLESEDFHIGWPKIAFLRNPPKPFWAECPQQAESAFAKMLTVEIEQMIGKSTIVRESKDGSTIFIDFVANPQEKRISIDRL